MAKGCIEAFPCTNYMCFETFPDTSHVCSPTHTHIAAQGLVFEQLTLLYPSPCRPCIQSDPDVLLPLCRSIYSMVCILQRTRPLTWGQEYSMMYMFSVGVCCTMFYYRITISWRWGIYCSMCTTGNWVTATGSAMSTL